MDKINLTITEEDAFAIVNALSFFNSVYTKHNDEEFTEILGYWTDVADATDLNKVNLLAQRIAESIDFN